MTSHQSLDENKVKNNFNLEDTNNAKEENHNRRFLYIAASTANLFSFTCGMALGWSSPMIPKLIENVESPLPESITPENISWIGSLLPMGAVIGPFAAGFSSDRYGRKKTILVSMIPMLVAFCLFAYASSVNYYYIGRFLCGLAIGGIFTVLPVYIGEIADDDVRSSLGSFLQLFIVVGLTFAYATGPYIHMFHFNVLAGLLLIIFIVGFYIIIPETPHYLIAKNELKIAETSLMKLRSMSRNQIKGEMMLIKESVQSAVEKQGGFSSMFTSKVVKKALAFTFLLMAYQQFCGITVVVFYTETIFTATGSSIPPDVSTIIIGVVQIVGSAITPMIVGKCGNRLLLIISASFTSLSTLTLGIFFYLKETGSNVDGIFWLPIASLIVYMITYCIGFGPLPWAVMGAMFPPEVKSVATTVIASSCWFMAFMITKFFSDVSLIIGIGGSFWVFAGCCAIAAFQIYKYLPETSRKSLQQIQEILASSK